MGSNRSGVVGPAEPERSTPAGRADQEQPTLWRMASDCARTARRRPCAEALANGFDSSSKTNACEHDRTSRIRCTRILVEKHPTGAAPETIREQPMTGAGRPRPLVLSRIEISFL